MKKILLLSSLITALNVLPAELNVLPEDKVSKNVALILQALDKSVEVGAATYIHNDVISEIDDQDIQKTIKRLKEAIDEREEILKNGELTDVEKKRAEYRLDMVRSAVTTLEKKATKSKSGALNVLPSDGTSNKNPELEMLNSRIEQMEQTPGADQNPALQQFITNLKKQRDALQNGTPLFTQTEKAAQKLQETAANSIARITARQEQTKRAIAESEKMSKLALEKKAAIEAEIANLSK